MSVFGAFYSKNHIAFVTDTIANLKTPRMKGGQILDTSFVALTSKTMYYPHFQTAVCSMGLTVLSNKLSEFINDSRQLICMDTFLRTFEADFVPFFQKDKEAMAIDYPEQKKNWLGAVIFIGPSVIETSEEGFSFDGERRLRIVKARVWKDKIELKHVSVLENKDFDIAFMPRLPQEGIDRIFSKDWSDEYPSQIDGVLIEHMKELKTRFDDSLRTDFMVGGELNLTVMNYERALLTVTQSTPYRFEDYEDNLKEIAEVNKLNL